MRYILSLVGGLCLFLTPTTADCGTQTGYSETRKRVAGGNVVDDVYKWQWTGHLRFSGQDVCTVVLVDHMWALTSAQCILKWTDPTIFTVVLGDGYGTGIEQTFGVTEMMIHPLFDHATREYDACLLKLSTPASNFDPICVVDEAFDYTTFDECWLTGYGQITGGTFPSKMHEALMDQVNKETCYSIWKQWSVPITDNHICAGFPTEQIGACHGDAGAPLNCVRDGIWFLGGILSFGSGKCGAIPGIPDVYTKMSTVFTDFIENAVNGLTPLSRSFDCHHETEFRCASPQCISSLYRCDGYTFCLGNDDEKYCAAHVKYFNPTYMTSFSDTPAESIVTANVDECADRCLTSHGYVCHQFAFRKSDGQCDLRFEDYQEVSLVSMPGTMYFRLQEFGGHAQTIHPNLLGNGQFSTPRYFNHNSRRKLTQLNLMTEPGTNIQIHFDHFFDDPSHPECPLCKAELRVRLNGSSTNLVDECITESSSLPSSIIAPGNEVVLEWFTERPELTGIIGSFSTVVP